MKNDFTETSFYRWIFALTMVGFLALPLVSGVGQNEWNTSLAAVEDEKGNGGPDGDWTLAIKAPKVKERHLPLM
jgi:hypothetical protein